MFQYTTVLDLPSWRYINLLKDNVNYRASNNNCHIDDKMSIIVESSIDPITKLSYSPLGN